MYVCRGTSNQHGKTYRRYLLRTSYRENGKVKHDTIANLSLCSEDEIKALKLALKHKGDLTKLVNIKEIGAKQGMRIGAVFSLKTIADRIGLSQVLGYHREGRLALWQVMARCINPGSRLKTVRLAQSHAACDVLGLDSFNEDHLYSNLEWIADHQEAIEMRLFRRYCSNGIPRLFLYDVTSSYLEGTQNELAAFGYNRDGKKGKMQLVIGLLTSPDGTPVATRVFEGNTPDTKTVAEQIRTLAENFGVQGITMVGDRGMLKQGEIDALNQESFSYITAITKPQIKKLLREGVFQMSLFEETICEVEHEGERYILRRNPIRAKEIAQTREEKLTRIRGFTSGRNVYLAEHPKAQVEVALMKVEELITRLKASGWIKAINHERTLLLVIDEDAKNKEAELDGCYAIRTDLPSEVVSAETIHARYKDLSKVERAFRTFKNGHLQIQPTHVRKEKSTRGYVFVVMLAYLLELEMENCWRHLETTVSEAIDELGSLRAVEFTVGDVTCQKVPEPVGLSLELLDAANIKLPEVLPLRKVHVATRKKLVPKRKSN